MTRRTLLTSLAATATVTLAADLPFAAAQGSTSLEEKQKQVADTERAFAKSMADRDHAAFTAHLAAETVFFAQTRALRGKEEVAAAWKRYYDGPKAPFSWQPDSVEVLASGTLGFTSGPVFDPDGKRTGTFNSVWRLEPDGKWRIVFDKGCPPCECK